MLARLRLVPQDERFFDQFDRSARNVVEGAQLLVDLLEHFENVDRKARHLKAVEHTGDEITHEIFRTLNRTFVTPLDREDISALASALDDVIDWIEEAANRLRLYRITETTPLSRQLGHVILEQAQFIATAIPLLNRRRSVDELERATHEIHRLENEADDLLADAVAHLYDGVTEIPQLIRAMHWGDVYQLLEDTTDKAEAVAAVVQNIAVKNA